MKKCYSFPKMRCSGFQWGFVEPPSYMDAGGVCSQMWGVMEKSQTPMNRRRWRGMAGSWPTTGIPMKAEPLNQESWGQGRDTDSGCIKPHRSGQLRRTEPMMRQSRLRQNLFSHEKMHRGKAQQQLVRYSTCNWSSPRWCTKGKKNRHKSRDNEN